jgi:hypothetical protein
MVLLHPESQSFFLIGVGYDASTLKIAYSVYKSPKFYKSTSNPTISFAILKVGRIVFSTDQIYDTNYAENL